MYNFLLVINSIFARISYRFQDIDAFFSTITCFPHLTHVRCFLAEELLAVSMILSLERTFNGLQFFAYNTVLSSFV